MPSYEIPGYNPHAGVYDFNRLIGYRYTPAGNNFPVHYLIGTTAYRWPGMMIVGNYYFDHILSNYAIPLRHWQPINNNRANIYQPLRFLNSYTGSAGLTIAHHKEGFHLDPTLLSVRMEPIEVPDDIISDVELAQRLFTWDNHLDAIRAIRGLLSPFAPHSQILVDGNFVLAGLGAHDRSVLDAMANTLNRALNFFSAFYGIPEPGHLLTIYMVNDSDTLNEVARHVHKLELPVSVVGYSCPGDLSVVGIADEQHIGTLLHELFHLVAHSHFGAIPPWLDEGLAALYEECRYYDDPSSPFIGVPNDRGTLLNMLKDEGYLIPSVEDLVTMSWLQFNALASPDMPPEVANRHQALNHAAARYFLLYLQQAGYPLPEVYHAFYDLLEEAPLEQIKRRLQIPGTDIKLEHPAACLERTVGSLINDINAKFQEFVTTGNAAPAVPFGMTTPAGIPTIKRTIEIPSDKPWVDTGIDIAAGDHISIHATGTVIFRPDLPPCGPGGARWTDTRDKRDPLWQAYHGGLIGKIGEEEQPFFIGTNLSINAPYNGRLLLRINDRDYQGNTGQFIVEVEIS